MLDPECGMLCNIADLTIGYISFIIKMQCLRSKEYACCHINQFTANCEPTSVPTLSHNSFKEYLARWPSPVKNSNNG